MARHRLSPGRLARRAGIRPGVLVYRLAPLRARRAVLAMLLDDQAARCQRLRSPLYAGLLRGAAEDVRRAGPCWDVFGASQRATGLPLRFMGTMHRLVLEGRVPELAAYYPSAGGQGPVAAAWEPFRTAVETHVDELRQGLEMPIQTNEVGRCRVMLGGFLEIAAQTGLPLRLLELGASAGLNLRWDLFHYSGPDGRWGNPDAHVKLTGLPAGIPLETQVRIVEREGCDIAPLDPFTPEGSLTLRSYIWADHRERLALLDAAIADARAVPAAVEGADARAWLEPRLETGARSGATTVVFHSFVTSLMGRRTSGEIRRMIEDAGRAATPEAPLAWLRLEPETGRSGLHLRLWPADNDRCLALSNAWGENVRWLDAEAGLQTREAMLAS